MSVKIIILNKLPELPRGKMRMFDNETEAVKAAEASGQAFVWHFPANHSYYVARTA